MKILSTLLTAAVIALVFPACATPQKKDACCGAKSEQCCAGDKKCPPSQCAAPGHTHGKKKGS